MGQDDTLSPPDRTARVHRSNLIGMLLGILFVPVLGLLLARMLV
ncbi:MAG: hypothetical protein ACREUB_05010 [Burkholderiales bacterium]